MLTTAKGMLKKKMQGNTVIKSSKNKLATPSMEMTLASLPSVSSKDPGESQDFAYCGSATASTLPIRAESGRICNEVVFRFPQ